MGEGGGRGSEYRRKLTGRNHKENKKGWKAFLIPFGSEDTHTQTDRHVKVANRISVYVYILKSYISSSNSPYLSWPRCFLPRK